MYVLLYQCAFNPCSNRVANYAIFRLHPKLASTATVAACDMINEGQQLEEMV